MNQGSPTYAHFVCKSKLSIDFQVNDLNELFMVGEKLQLKVFCEVNESDFQSRPHGGFDNE